MLSQTGLRKTSNKNKVMKTTDFEQGLKRVANEMKLTKNIFTAASKEQLEIAAQACNVEHYKYENCDAYFLMKDGQVKDAKLFEEGDLVHLYKYGLEPDSLYLDFIENGVKQ